MYVFGSGWRRRRVGLVDEMIGFGLYQSCGNKGSVCVWIAVVCMLYVGTGQGAWTRVCESGSFV